MSDKRKLYMLTAITLITVVLTIFFYTSERFPLLTSIASAPVTAFSSIANFFGFKIPVYETTWAVALANTLAAVIIVWLFDKIRSQLIK